MRNAESVIREIEEITNLCLKLAHVARKGALHARNPLQPSLPSPEDILYEPSDVELARRHRAVSK